jgi:hypothetical protein
MTPKFVAATFTGISIVGCWIASNWLHTAALTFGTLVTGLCTVLAAFTAGHVVQASTAPGVSTAQE